MHQIALTQKTLQPHLGWHGARVKFLALFLVALFRVKTVNLTELATGFMGQAKLLHNVLMFGVVHNGIAFPLLWSNAR